jgi:hypothetical protein
MLYKGRAVCDKSVKHPKEEHRLELHVVYSVFTEEVMVRDLLWYIPYMRFTFFLGGGVFIDSVHNSYYSVSNHNMIHEK